MDNADGDRVKVAYLNGADLARAHAVLQNARVDSVVDFVSATVPYSSLQSTAAKYTTAIEQADTGAATPIAMSIDEKQGSLHVFSPTHPTAAQQQVLQQLAGEPNTVVSVQDISVTNTACNTSGVLQCDAPFRGGTFWHIDGNGSNRACTTGFYVTSKTDSAPYFLSAGHCFELTDGSPGTLTLSGWTTYAYTSNGSSIKYFSGVHNALDNSYGDFSLIPFNSLYPWSPTNWVAVLNRGQTTENLAYTITADADPANGSRVCYTGASGRNTYCGTVTDAAFIVGGQSLIRDNACNLVAGDSGGPNYASNTAYGLTKGIVTIGGVPQSCDMAFSRISAAEYQLNVNVAH